MSRFNFLDSKLSRMVRNVGVTGTREEHWDTKVPGLGIRINRQSASFFVRYRYGGKQHRHTLGKYPRKTLLKARAEARDMLERIENKEPPVVLEGETVGAVAKRMMATVERNLRPNSVRSYKQHLKRHVIPRWGEVPIRDVRRGDVLEALEEIVKETPTTANRVRRMLSQIWARAVEEDLLEHNIIRDIRAPHRPKPRQRVLSDEEIALLWQYWEEKRTIQTAAFRLLLLTGQRLREVLDMRVEEMQGDGWWMIPGSRTKNSRPQAVWLTPMAQAVLAEVEPYTAAVGGLYLPSTLDGKPLSNLDYATRKALAETEVDHFTRHDLRRTFATGLGRLGVEDRIIERCLNHAPRSVQGKHYNHWAYKEKKAQAWQKWADHLARVVGRGGSVVVPFSG